MYFGSNSAKLNIIHNTIKKQQEDTCIFRLPNEVTRIDGDDPEYNLKLFRRFENFPHSISVDLNNLEEVGTEALYLTFEECYGKKITCTKLRRVYGDDGCFGLFIRSDFEEINLILLQLKSFLGIMLLLGHLKIV